MWDNLRIYQFGSGLAQTTRVVENDRLRKSRYQRE